MTDIFTQRSCCTDTYLDKLEVCLDNCLEVEVSKGYWQRGWKTIFYPSGGGQPTDVRLSRKGW